MAEDKKERGGERRGSIEADDESAVNNFARKHNITTRQARELIREVGSNPEKLCTLKSWRSPRPAEYWHTRRSAQAIAVRNHVWSFA